MKTQTKEEYEQWINSYPGSKHRRCKEVCQEMLRVFPELELVKGLIRLSDGTGKQYTHVWLVDSEKNIIDPTADQYGVAIAEYHVPEETPTGKCLNCGDYVYRNLTFCNQSCSIQMQLSMMGGMHCQ